MKKDVPTLLRAFALVAAERPVRLIVLGEGRGLEELRALSHELGIAALRWFQNRSDLAGADVFALSSSTGGGDGVWYVGGQH